MSEIHKRVLHLGAQKAREQSSPSDRPLIDLAERMLSDDDATRGFTYAGFCVVQLPHKRMPDDEIWVRSFSDLTLTVEPGTSPRDRRKRVGVPYGARARMVLLYLQTEAVRQNDPVVELGNSMHDWMQRMDIGIGGKTYRDMRDQMERICACKLTFSKSAPGGRAEFVQNTIVEAGSILAFEHEAPQARLWNDTLRLSEAFFSELKKNPVVVRDEAVRKLSSHSQALDVYIWLAHILPGLERDKRMSWRLLFEQFGGGYARERDWRRYFIGNLGRALTVYEGARVEMGKGGLILRPSPSPLETARRLYLIGQD